MKVVIDNLTLEDVSSIYDVFSDYLHRIALDKIENRNYSHLADWYQEHYDYILALKNKIEVVNENN